MGRAGHHRHRHARPHPPPSHAWRAARGAVARVAPARRGAAGGAGESRAQGDASFRAGPGGADVEDDVRGMARTVAAGAQGPIARGWRRAVRRRRRLRREDQHSSLAARTRLSRRRAATHGDMDRRRGGEARRPGAFERPWRPVGARRASAACQGRSGSDSDDGHLPRPPDPRPRGRRDHIPVEVRPPRGQPPGQGPRVGPRAHHEPEPRVPGGRGLAARGRLLRLAAQPQRRIGGRARPPHSARVQRAVPPRGMPGPAGQPVRV